MPTEASLQKDIQNLIDAYEFNLGEPCGPYILTKSSVNEEGQVVTDSTEVYGRKIEPGNRFYKDTTNICV